MTSVDARSPSGNRVPGERPDDAPRIAAHLSALGRWIDMLRAQGVNPNDEGLVALARRRQALERQQRNGETRG